MLFFIKICNLVNIFSKNEKETWKKDFYEKNFTTFKNKYITKLATLRPRKAFPRSSIFAALL